MAEPFVTESPMLPAKCAVCNVEALNGKKFVDFNNDLDYYGAILICTDCIKAIIELVEYDPVANLKAELEKVTLHLEVADDQLNEYRSFIESMRSVMPDLELPDLGLNSDEKDIAESIENSTGLLFGSDSDANESDSSGGSEDSTLFAS